MFFQTLILSAILETGFVSGGIFNYSSENKAWVDVGALYTTLEAKAEYQCFYLGGNMDCYFTPTSIVNYMPFQMTYGVQAGLNFKHFQIGYEHSCFHPMTPYATIFGNEIKPKYEGAYNKVFLRWKINR